ncbi:MAG: DUF4446 family protein [bacterium]|nr:DUF4446 family protein [bacterium]
MLLSPQLMGVLVFVFIWLIAVSVFFLRQNRRFRKLTEGSSKENLIGVLEKVQKRQSEIEKDIKDLGFEVKGMENQAKEHIQKVGLIRFNPFPETGGDQSFTLALLDGTKSGLVISSLHSRQSTRIYAKPVKVGKVEEYQSSKEEAQAIQKACK